MDTLGLDWDSVLLKDDTLREEIVEINLLQGILQSNSDFLTESQLREAKAVESKSQDLEAHSLTLAQRTLPRDMLMVEVVPSFTTLG